METIIKHLTDSRNSMENAIEAIQANRGRGLTNDDAIRISQIRNELQAEIVRLAGMFG